MTPIPKSEPRSPASHETDLIEPTGKCLFVKPALTCHGTVVDLTNQLGGSLTPEEREEQGLIRREMDYSLCGVSLRVDCIPPSGAGKLRCILERLFSLAPA